MLRPFAFLAFKIERTPWPGSTLPLEESNHLTFIALVCAGHPSALCAAAHSIGLEASTQFGPNAEHPPFNPCAYQSYSAVVGDGVGDGLVVRAGVVGPGVGDGVGAGVGPGVGAGVGLGVGDGVGDGVGAGVGPGVGAGVGLRVVIGAHEADVVSRSHVSYAK